MFDAKKVLIPYPKKISETGTEIQIGKTASAGFSFKTSGSGIVFEEAKMLFWNKMSEKTAITSDCKEASYSITLRINPECECLEGRSESYCIEITSNKADICAFDEAGAYYGAVTFAELVHTEGEKVLIPEITIVDWPDFKDRGQFLECRYGSDFMTLDDWKSAVDYFASLKQNQLTVGVYGCWDIQYDNQRAEYLYIPFKKYPELKTPRNIKYYSVKNRKWIIKENVLPEMFEKDFFGELAEYGKRKNVKIKPLFNSLGHNSLFPRIFPEISAKNPDGSDKCFGYCTEREETYRFMYDLYDEIIDRYLTPNGIDAIEIGLDEVLPSIGVYADDIYKKVSPFCECELCRNKEQKDIMFDYIIKICKYLKSKGMKSIYIYHDMLFDFNVINEDLKQRFTEEGIYDIVVIDWWSYSATEKVFGGRMNELNTVFRGIIKPMTGYYHWSIPTETAANIQLLAKKAKELGLEGIEPYGAYEESCDKNFRYSADLSWNADTADDMEHFNNRYVASLFGGSKEASQALEIIQKLMSADVVRNKSLRILEYYFYGYLRAEKPYPRHFPEEAFNEILANEEEFSKYLNETHAQSSKAAELLEKGSAGYMSDVYLLIAKHYQALTDLYLTLTGLYKSYDSVSPETFKFEIGRLIDGWEDVMKLAENVRMEGNSYLYLRNMSIFRQFLVDLQNYICAETADGRKPKFDITNFEHINSELYFSIR
ncbi:MAG: family 20 glycosylhydrolase [Clostridia bacterium]|nr:family 20 glycosylhydrolase [Clostridia bacterium]